MNKDQKIIFGLKVLCGAGLVVYHVFKVKATFYKGMCAGIEECRKMVMEQVIEENHSRKKHNKA